MTTNIDARSLSINYFNLECTSLSLIVFAFGKATLGCGSRTLWSLGDLRACLWALFRTSYT